MTKVTLLTQDDCTLCDHAKNVSHGRLSEKRLRRILERAAVTASVAGKQPTSRKAGAL